MYLVVDLRVADETFGARRVVAVVELRERSGTQQRVGGELIAAARTVVPESVGGRVVNRTVLVAPVGVDRGVEEGCRADHPARGVALRGDHTLRIHIDRQVLVEEVGREAQIEGPAFVFRGFERALLVGVAHRGAVGHAVVDVARQADIVVVRDGRPEDEFLPVGVLVAHHGVHLVAGGGSRGEDAVHIAAELSGGHHGQLVGVGLYAHAAAVRHARGVALALLGRDHDYAVRGARTVDRCRRGILEYGERLDVVGIDRLERVGHTRAAVRGDGHAVDHDQRIVRGIERCGAADADRRTRTGTSVTGNDVYARHLALEHVLGRYDGSAVELLGLDGYDRSGHVVLLDRTVADDHHVVDAHGILFERESGEQRRRGYQLDGLVADVADLDHRFGRGHTDGIVAVDSGRDAVGRTLLDHGRSQNRHSRFVYNYALYLIASVLRQRKGGGNQAGQQDSHTHSQKFFHRNFGWLINWFLSGSVYRAASSRTKPTERAASSMNRPARASIHTALLAKQYLTMAPPVSPMTICGMVIVKLKIPM